MNRLTLDGAATARNIPKVGVAIRFTNDKIALYLMKESRGMTTNVEFVVHDADRKKHS
ncbi:MAG: hypothetical protein ABI378_10695 [Chitinophagaceae bacterium]